MPIFLNIVQSYTYPGKNKKNNREKNGSEDCDNKLGLLVKEKTVFFGKMSARKLIGHFRVALNLSMKARLRAQFLLWKLVFIHMQTKLIFIWKVLHLASLS